MIRRTNRLPSAPVAPARDPGEHPLEDDARERVTVGEVAVHGKADLAGAVGGAYPGALDPDPPPAEGDLAGLVAVAHGLSLGVMAALGADDLGDIFFHQLGEDTELMPTDRAKRLSWATPTSSPSASCTRGDRGRSLLVTACADGTVSFTAVPLSIWQIAPKAPTGSGRRRRTAVLKFYGLRDNLRSPVVWCGRSVPSVSIPGAMPCSSTARSITAIASAARQRRLSCQPTISRVQQSMIAFR